MSGTYTKDLAEEALKVARRADARSLLQGPRTTATEQAVATAVATADEAMNVATGAVETANDAEVAAGDAVSTAGDALAATEATDDGIALLTARSCVRDPGNGVSATVADANVHSLGIIQANTPYGLRIIASTSGQTVLGHYRSDTTNPDGNDTPISGGDPEHIIQVTSGGAVRIIRNATYTNNFIAYLYPLNGGTITAE